jgi:hypothetical protein
MRYCLFLMLLSLFRIQAFRPATQQRLFARGRTRIPTRHGMAPTNTNEASRHVTAGLQSILQTPSEDEAIDPDELVTVKNTQRKVPIDTDAVRETMKTLKAIMGVEDFSVRCIL